MATISYRASQSFRAIAMKNIESVEANTKNIPIFHTNSDKMIFKNIFSFFLFCNLVAMATNQREHWAEKSSAW